MKSVILIGDKKFSIEKIQEIKLDKFISCHKTDTSLAIELENGRLYLDYSEDIIQDYEENELENIPIKNPRFIAIQFSSVEALKVLLSELRNFDKLLVDDDKGNIIGINRYLINI